jgi:hypothetical protein
VRQALRGRALLCMCSEQSTARAERVFKGNTCTEHHTQPNDTSRHPTSEHTGVPTTTDALWEGNLRREMWNTG